MTHANNGMSSIIIPAHNEEAQISRCLGALLRDAHPDEFDVIVVCNGCADRTAAIARTFGPGVKVHELPVASKSAALNFGDDRALRFPRVYLDADSEIDTASMRALVSALEGETLATYPTIQTDLTGVSRVVRLYMRTWQLLCLERRDFIGCGVYALSSIGRDRFDRFPDLAADDLYVRAHFAHRETRIAVGAVSIVRPPRTVPSLVRVLTRVFVGNTLHERQFGYRNDARRASLVSIARRDPTTWLSAVAYLVVVAIAKARARVAVRFGDVTTWSHDRSSRTERDSNRTAVL